jgi:hypothetical protein
LSNNIFYSLLLLLLLLLLWLGVFIMQIFERRLISRIQWARVGEPHESNVKNTIKMYTTLPPIHIFIYARRLFVQFAFRVAKHL